VCSFLLLCCLAGSVAARSRSVWDGTYTKAQAARGKTVYEHTCTRCHGETLLGGDDAKPLVGEAFLEKWNGQTVGKLFDAIRRTMPDDGPGVLGRRESADVVAYILSANGFPAGQAELENEDAPLNEILIKAKR
jgi:mono/diheme cytochrome c family protein